MKITLFDRLAVKIGIIVVIAEIIVLTIVGVVYINNFTTQIQQNLIERTQLPGQLMSNGLLDLDAVSDQETMSTLVGEELKSGLIIGVNGNVFFALNPDNIGQSAEDLSGIDVNILDAAISEAIYVIDEDSINSISPIFSADGETIRFFVYVDADTSASQAQQQQILTLFVLGSVVTVVVTSVIIILAFNLTILQRIRQLAFIMGQAEAGNLDVQVSGEISKDEIGFLEEAANSMIVQLKSLFNTLEQRIADRTRDLQVAADVSRDVTTILEEDDLLQVVVNRTKEGFSLYRVAVFLYEETTTQLVLESSTDRQSSENKTHFILTDNAIVTKAGQSLETVLINDVSKSDLHLFNKDLPDTKSELALPMLVGNQLVGVLDLQSEQVNRFSEDDIRVLTTLAEQIGIAVQNAKLFTEVQEARQIAEQSDQVKSAFLASMSHELRTPLNAIISFSFFIARGDLGTVNEQQKSMLDDVVNSAKHLLSLINDVLDMSKIEAGSLNLFVVDDLDLQPIIQQIMSTARILVKDKPVELIEQTSNNLPYIRGDKQRITQILLNIISNACKFTETGTITFKVNQKDDSIVFSISDTGAGIAETDIESVFEPFKQTTTGLRQSGGTGLGMPICKTWLRFMVANYGCKARSGLAQPSSCHCQSNLRYYLLQFKDEKNDKLH